MPPPQPQMSPLRILCFPFSIFWEVMNTKIPMWVMKKKMNDLDVDSERFLPLEVMFEILSRLTVASLLRCKCVCKRWNAIIQHPKFIQMHRIRSRENVFYNPAESFKILICFHGLLVEESKISGMYRIQNPTTRQILVLPNPNVEPIYRTLLVFLESTNSYKLVFVYDRTEGYIGNIGFKVLSFGGSDLSWRDLAKSYFCRLDITRQRVSMIVIGRLIYCVGLYEDGSTDSQIYLLDVETGILTDSPIIVPRSFFSNWNNAWLIKWGNKVAVMNIVEEELHVWVLEDPVKGNWAEKKIIIPLTFLKDMKGTVLLHSASPEQIWFRKDGVQLIGYDTRSKQVLKSQYSAPSGKIIRNGIRSLVTLKGIQTKKQQKSDEVEEIEAKYVYSLRNDSEKTLLTTTILIMLVAYFERIICLFSKFRG